MKKITFLVTNDAYEKILALTNKIKHDEKRKDFLIENIEKTSLKSLEKIEFYIKRIKRNQIKLKLINEICFDINTSLVENID